MNVQNGYGRIHHLVEETLRLLCGHSEPMCDWSGHRVAAEITCPACFRLLADEARRAAPRTHDSED